MSILGLSHGTELFETQDNKTNRHIVIFATEDFKSNNHLQIDTINCYCRKKDYNFHLLDLDKTNTCHHTAEFFRRHCLLADSMKNWKENDFIYFLDSDVISHNFEGNWHWDDEEKYDLIFYERWWNGMSTYFY